MNCQTYRPCARELLKLAARWRAKSRNMATARGRLISPRWSAVSKGGQWVPVSFIRHVRSKTSGDARKLHSVQRVTSTRARFSSSRASRTRARSSTSVGERQRGERVTRRDAEWRLESDRVHRSAEFYDASLGQLTSRALLDERTPKREKKVTAAIPGRRWSDRGRGAEQECSNRWNDNNNTVS